MTRRIIDVHNHPNWHGHDIDALVKNMDEHGIEKTWLLSWEIPEAEFNVDPYNHECMDPRGLCAPLYMVVEGLKRYPDRFIGGWAPDPRDRYARAKLKAAVSVHKIKIYGELKCRMRYDSPDALATFDYCGQLGLPVLFHLGCPPIILKSMKRDIHNWLGWYGGDMATVETMCRECPDTTFIGHAPGFWRDISGDVEQCENPYPSGPVTPGGKLIDALRKWPNLHCDLSAGSGANSLERDLEHAKKFVLEFQDRVMFGRDYFDRRLMDILEKLDLSEVVMDKILYQNAERLIEKPGKSI